MSTERERVFLVSGDAWRRAGEHPVSRIEQGYLCISEICEVRVRRREGGEATLTVKDRRAGIERVEVELPCSTDQAGELWELCCYRLLKQRSLVRHAGWVWEVDVYEGELAGLVLAEVEFGKGEEPLLPAWLGDEVTDDLRYRNAALAVDGRPA